MNKQPIVDQDKYEGEWVALDPKTDAVLSPTAAADHERLDPEIHPSVQGLEVVERSRQADSGQVVGLRNRGGRGAGEN